MPERLSPDARFPACVDPEVTRRLLDVGTGATVLERGKYGEASLDITRTPGALAAYCCTVTITVWVWWPEGIV